MQTSQRGRDMVAFEPNTSSNRRHKQKHQKKKSTPKTDWAPNGLLLLRVITLGALRTSRKIQTTKYRYMRCSMFLLSWQYRRFSYHHSSIGCVVRKKSVMSSGHSGFEVKISVPVMRTNCCTSIERENRFGWWTIKEWRYRNWTEGCIWHNVEVCFYIGILELLK